MKYKAIYVLAAALSLSMAQLGSAMAAMPEPQLTDIQVKHMTRQYFLYYRPVSPEPVPLLIVLHAGDTQVSNARKLEFEALADRDHFAIVYPKAINQKWADGRRTDFTRNNPRVDDVAFLRELIDSLIQQRIADPQRIYVTGLSDGGIMAYRAGCEMADRVAAIASVSASMPLGYNYICHPSTALPVLAINGTADAIMPWAGGQVRIGGATRDYGAIIPVSDTLAFWKRKASCKDNEKLETLAEDKSTAMTAIKHSWEGCDVRQYEIRGGGHGWPGKYTPLLIAYPYPGNMMMKLDATTEIWEFFKDKRKLPGRR